MLDTRLESIEHRYNQLEESMSDPEVSTDPRRLMEIGKERSELTDIVELYRRYREVGRQLAETEVILGENSADQEMAELARVEIEDLKAQRHTLLEEIKQMLIPKDPNDDKNVIIEIRAGAGGDE